MTFRVAEPVLFQVSLHKFCTVHGTTSSIKPNVIRKARFKVIMRLNCTEKMVLEAASNSRISVMLNEYLTGLLSSTVERIYKRGVMLTEHEDAVDEPVTTSARPSRTMLVQRNVTRPIHGADSADICATIPRPNNLAPESLSVSVINVNFLSFFGWGDEERNRFEERRVVRNEKKKVFPW